MMPLRPDPEPDPQHWQYLLLKQYLTGQIFSQDHSKESYIVYEWSVLVIFFLNCNKTTARILWQVIESLNRPKHKQTETVPSTLMLYHSPTASTENCSY
jgi:hypothetical protein